jgi:hypothetical protein
MLQALGLLALHPEFHEVMLKYDLPDTVMSLVLPGDELFYTNQTTKYAKYVKHLAARILVYLGLYVKVSNKVNLFDILETHPEAIDKNKPQTFENHFIHQMAIGEHLITNIWNLNTKAISIEKLLDDILREIRNDNNDKITFNFNKNCQNYTFNMSYLTSVVHPLIIIRMLEHRLFTPLLRKTNSRAVNSNSLFLPSSRAQTTTTTTTAPPTTINNYVGKVTPSSSIASKHSNLSTTESNSKIKIKKSDSFANRFSNRLSIRRHSKAPINEIEPTTTTTITTTTLTTAPPNDTSSSSKTTKLKDLSKKILRMNTGSRVALNLINNSKSTKNIKKSSDNEDNSTTTMNDNSLSVRHLLQRYSFGSSNHNHHNNEPNSQSNNLTVERGRHSSVTPISLKKMSLRNASIDCSQRQNINNKDKDNTSDNASINKNTNLNDLSEIKEFEKKLINLPTFTISDENGDNNDNKYNLSSSSFSLLIAPTVGSAVVGGNGGSGGGSSSSVYGEESINNNIDDQNNAKTKLQSKSSVTNTTDLTTTIKRTKKDNIFKTSLKKRGTTSLKKRKNSSIIIKNRNSIYISTNDIRVN